MDIAPDRLLDYPVPEARQTITRRDCAFYALSVGFGQDPTDLREHRFVDPARPMAAVPSMALVLAYPGFWLGDPATGVNAAQVAHVDQEIVLHAPVPTGGTVVGRTRVTGLYSRGEGRGLALTSAREIASLDGGTPIATVSQTHFLRGDVSSRALPDYRGGAARLPDGEPDWVFEQTTRPEQALLYRLNGDLNPLHLDPAVAALAGFDRPILHGMCTFGVAVRAVLATMTGFDPTALRRVAMAFRAPVYPGETLRTEIWADGAFRVRAVERDQVVVDGGKVEFSNAEGRRPAGAAAPLARASAAEKA